MKKIFNLFCFLFLISLSFSQEFAIKFASFAPEGSTWINVMKEYDQAVRKESGGRIGFRIYAGGSMGDEKDYVRKMRLGQLHSAGITGNGITEIAKAVRILDSPFLFKNASEIDYIVEQFDGELRKEFEAGGFVLLGWADVGSVYVFTNTPVAKISDLDNVKMWEWEGDPVANITFKTIGINTHKISISEALQSLQTGLIDGVYNTPYGIVTLQWFSAVKYMMDYPLTNSMGGVVISKREYDKLAPDLQQILLKNGKIYLRKLTELGRKDNQKLLETLKKNKIQFVKPDAAEAKSYDELGKKARQAMAGRLFSQDLLDRVEKALADYRAKGGK